jgi:hypothetical protein
VRATAVHPGGIQTELSRHIGAEEIATLVERINTALADRGKPPFQFKTIPQGAATSVWAGVVATADEVGGRYCEDCHVTTLVTDEPLDPMSGGVRPYALDAAHAALLWEKSEELVGERF